VITDSFISLSLDDSPFAAYDLITRSGVHHLPVINWQGQCVAMLDAVVALARASEELLHPQARLLELRGAVRPLGVLPETSLRRVATKMTNAGVDACVVVDERGRMLGLITARDVVAAVAGKRLNQPAA